MSELIHTQLIKINLAEFETKVLEFICRRSNSLYNQGIYYIKTNHLLTHPVSLPNVPYEQLAADLKEEWNYAMLYSQVAQQTLKSVSEAFNSYRGLMQAWWSRELEQEPKQPKYRKKGGLYPVTYPSQALTFYHDKSVVRIPLGLGLAEEDGLKELFIPRPANIKPSQVVEVSIVPRNGVFYAAYVYKVSRLVAFLDKSRALGIDPNTKNWLACVSIIGKSFIIVGGRVKFWNQKRNKTIAAIKEGKAQDYWDEECQQIEESRNRRMRDAINKAARFIVNWCLQNNIGTIVFGWNQGQKDGANMGKHNNQGFVQIPTGRLKERIQQLAVEIGIQFVETEESYTSKSSFLDGDDIPVFGEKLEGWQPSGKRGERKKGDKKNRLGRGTYCTANGIYINADLNGAANILNKVTTQLGINLAEVGRGALTLPKRYEVFKSLKRSYRKRCEACLQTA